MIKEKTFPPPQRSYIKSTWKLNAPTFVSSAVSVERPSLENKACWTTKTLTLEPSPSLVTNASQSSQLRASWWDTRSSSTQQKDRTSAPIPIVIMQRLKSRGWRNTCGFTLVRGHFSVSSALTLPHWRLIWRDTRVMFTGRSSHTSVTSAIQGSPNKEVWSFTGKVTLEKNQSGSVRCAILQWLAR